MRAIEAALDAVENLSEDRVLRQYLALILATTRTNFWRRDAAGRAAQLPVVQVRPGEGAGSARAASRCSRSSSTRRASRACTCAAASVARGGLRWSDRPEDFRTEVLGLVKAQMVKNIVIVPVGSKGGFVLKRAPPPADRDAYHEGGHRLLPGLPARRCSTSPTTASATGSCRRRRCKRHDPDDPYLVVAADKGTATFSDYANAISKEYGFWLGDAFASGGSAGYDHKAMGITARGAWESVKRHFREMGVDTQTTDFTVAGIGDMSGDVFGNGMLLSRHIRLVAAFDHRHIFLDPEPGSGVELRRARAAVQAAALVVGRLRREADLGRRRHPSAQREVDRDHAARSRRRSAITADALTPTELVNAILKAPVDLLYNGGIGTYVKATGETHAQVGDRANDALRVNGRELRCKVVRRGRQPRLHAARPHRVRAGRRAHLHRRDRQLGGRRHVRPRGEHQDPARPGRSPTASSPRSSATRCSPR